MSFYSSYFSFLSQGVLFTDVTTPLYICFIAFVVPSKVLIEVSARFGFLHKNRFFVASRSDGSLLEGLIWKTTLSWTTHREVHLLSVLNAESLGPILLLDQNSS